ncbi:hypothetical protein GJ744_009086 [Endocarpon pusillum]|uniref:Uncharacterized protein n=1 Tax=Endocarpon pusillum TaxID=364733 RepID=A0A8H7AKB2_9EURO|nr:hypothetical protein GJ744_009086 [Endocarpon pusillum]
MPDLGWSVMRVDFLCIPDNARHVDDEQKYRPLEAEREYFCPVSGAVSGVRGRQIIISELDRQGEE